MPAPLSRKGNGRYARMRNQWKRSFLSIPQQSGLGRESSTLLLRVTREGRVFARLAQSSKDVVCLPVAPRCRKETPSGLRATEDTLQVVIRGSRWERRRSTPSS